MPKFYRRILWIVLGLLAWGVFSLGGALAAGRLTSKQVAVLSGGIKVYLDGKAVNLHGMEPLLLQNEGAVMVPARALLESLGYKVTWDSGNYSINLTSSTAGSSPSASSLPPAGQGVSQPAGPPAGSPAGGVPAAPAAPVPNQQGFAPQPPGPQINWLENMRVLRNLGPFYRRQGRSYYIAGRPYEHGIAAVLEKEGSVAQTVIDIQGKYNSFTGYVGVEDETKNSKGGFALTVYGDDRELYTTPVIRPAAYPFIISLGTDYLNGVQRLTLEAKWVNVGLVGEYDKIIAVLADVRLD